jgi:hypothetical protein
VDPAEAADPRNVIERNDGPGERSRRLVTFTFVVEEVGTK